MSLARLLRNRWFLAAAGVGMAIYFVLLGMFLYGLLRGESATASDRTLARFEAGVPVLTLSRKGEVLDPEQPLSAAEVARLLPALRQFTLWLARWHGRPPSQNIIVAAPAEAAYRRVYDVLKLCQTVGFEGHDLRAGAAAGVRVRFPRPRQPQPPARSDEDILKLSADDLRLPVRITVLLRADAGGGLAAIVVRSLEGGEVGIAEAADLTRYLRQWTEIGDQDEVEIVADGALGFGNLTAVLAACRQAGFTQLVLAVPPDLRPKRRDPLDD